jgi:hypothetical protein
LRKKRLLPKKLHRLKLPLKKHLLPLKKHLLPKKRLLLKKLLLPQKKQLKKRPRAKLWLTTPSRLPPFLARTA